eukprot:symbB.v1.2.002321.t1/scaffold123.1/size315817/6
MTSTQCRLPLQLEVKRNHQKPRRLKLNSQRKQVERSERLRKVKTWRLEKKAREEELPLAPAKKAKVSKKPKVVEEQGEEAPPPAAPTKTKALKKKRKAAKEEGRKRWSIWHPEDAHLLCPEVLPGKVFPRFPDLADLEVPRPRAVRAVRAVAGKAATRWDTVGFGGRRLNVLAPYRGPVEPTAHR